jgi:cytochrome c oxidase cbb3-type subunit III
MAPNRDRKAPFARAGILLSIVLPLAAQQHAGISSPQDIENGARLYAVNCAACHGQDGDLVAGIDLRRGQFRRASGDEQLGRLILQGIPGTAMPPHAFNPADLATLVTYLHTMRDFGSRAVPSGNPARGRALFEGKAACASCHRVNGKGSRIAPDLSEIGAIRPASALETALLEPQKSALPQNRFVHAVTRDGKVFKGRRLNEDTFSVQLIDEHERLVSLAKSDLREYKIQRGAAMPSYKDKLTDQERADVVAYLASLTGSRNK